MNLTTILGEQNFGVGSRVYDEHKRRVAKSVEIYLETNPAIANYEIQDAIRRLSKEKKLDSEIVRHFYRNSAMYCGAGNTFLRTSPKIKNIDLDDAVRKTLELTDETEVEIDVQITSIEGGDRSPNNCSIGRRKQSVLAGNVFYKTEEGLKEYIKSKILKSHKKVRVEYNE
ncbi:hypothetical protein J4211_01150 [Candidatus Woesearchaeota archaeon]|nr:hypothetical protein [Candidatus Woesearchaeota archaeon]